VLKRFTLNNPHKKKLLLCFAFLIVLCIGVIDSQTPTEMPLLGFYLVPIFFVAYYLGFPMGAVVSAASIAAYLIADRIFSIRYIRHEIPYWNSAVWFIFFIAVAYIFGNKKRAEERLQQSEERFRLLVEGVTDYALLMLNRKGRIVNWNAGAQRLFGYTAEQVTGEEISIFYSSDDVANSKAHFDLERSEEKTKLTEEGWRVRADGTKFWADSLLTPLYDENSSLRGYSLLIRDMTHRKESEAKLRTLAELHEIDRAILSADTSVRVAEEALSGLQNMISFRGGSILLFPPNHEKAELLAACGGVTGKPRNLSEFDGLEFLIRGQNYDLSATEIQIPLHSHDKLIGVIELENHEPFSSDQIGISREVADQLAIAIHNTQLFEQLSDADQKLQILLQRLIEVQEAEKRHLARELHDEMGQSLTALKIELEQIESTNDPLLQLRSQNGLSIVDKLLEQARSLSAELRPTMLDDLGLIPALRWCVSRQSLVAGFSANFFEDLGDINLPPEVQTTCFRVAQEALTNVARHANATSVSVEITGSSQRLNLLIKDDGRGFDVSNVQRQASPGKCLGLLGMKERVMLIGGDIEVESAPDCGTEVRVYLPIQN